MFTVIFYILPPYIHAYNWWRVSKLQVRRKSFSLFVGITESVVAHLEAYILFSSKS